MSVELGTVWGVFRELTGFPASESVGRRLVS